MFSRRIRNIAVLALSLVAGRALSAQTPAEILARYAKAVDPDGKAASIQGMTSTMTMEMPAMGMSATVSSVQRRPNLVSVKITLPGLGEMRSGFDGSTAWASDPMQGPRLVSGAEAAQTIDNADFGMLTRPASMFESSELAGEGDVGGEKCIRVKHVWKSKRVTTDCYSVKTGLIIESMSKQMSPQGEIDAVSRLSDYRSVGGILMAHKVVVQVMGMEQVMTITSAEAGDPDPKLFELPAEVKALKKP